MDVPWQVLYEVAHLGLAPATASRRVAAVGVPVRCAADMWVRQPDGNLTSLDIAAPLAAYAAGLGVAQLQAQAIVRATNLRNVARHDSLDADTGFQQRRGLA